MKKSVLLSLAFLSGSAVATPYMGLEYGAASVKHDYQTHFRADNKTVVASDSSSVFGGFIGYKTENNYGLELSYKQFDLDGDSSQLLLSDKPGFILEREWESDLSVKQISLKPVVFYSLSENIQLKGGLGLTYSHYKYTSSSHDEYEHVLNDDIEINLPRSGGESKKDSALGIVASVGVDYNLYRNIHIGAAMEYYVDSIANGGNITVNTSYFF
ncbi:AcfA family outer membrane beta-barrel protein [Photobacterium sp. GB-3]|uniref:AcfA family outer membrane beta-barrel protein n=1 Tax=Photobacterium sp. GB-3 TaxID=2022110 RepID=UPI000D1635A1|nr:AcfA family outer membrane beta-barrel protein [Photobacterium sp. GB-3]PSV57340.1 peptide ABC transporter permease [Photobacterium sp. GB-3]